MNIVPIPAFSDNYIWMLVQDGRAAVVDPGDAQPVLSTLASMGLALDTIIITHHHFDHTGGVTALKSETNCSVIGPDNPKIQGIDQVLSEGQSVSVLGYTFEILEVPGHTLDHIAFYCPRESVLFCGDTLFVGGCGRVFEGTFPMMQASLAKLAVLPGDTAVYCTHEYTLANLAFAQKVDPHNEKLATHLAECEGKRAHGVPTVPSTIQNELEINPFLRWNASAIIAQLKQQGRHRGDSPADVFGAVRGWKDEG